MAIGQGAVTVTPIQLAVAIGGLAMGGVWYRPHLVQADSGAETPRRVGTACRKISPPSSPACAASSNEGGTGASAQHPRNRICGKTGSAQRISNTLAEANKALAEAMKDNGWFVGFAPCEHPEIVVVALWEAGEHGALAAPIVRDVIKAYFDKKARQSQVRRSRSPAVRRRPEMTKAGDSQQL